MAKNTNYFEELTKGRSFKKETFVYEPNRHQQKEKTDEEQLQEQLTILVNQNSALKEALQYLVETKERKDTIGKDSIYFQRKKFGWMKAKSLLKELNV